MKKGILVYHPSGNQNVRALLHALKAKEMLHTYHTTIATFKNAFYYKFFSIKKLSRFKRRTYPDNIRKQTILYPFLEILLMAGIKRYKNIQLSGSSINKILAYKVGKYIQKEKEDYIEGVYCFPFGALPIFIEAKKRGIKCFYEQTTGYYKELKNITNKEKDRNPEWASSIKIYEEPQNILDKLDKELELADQIIVASTYIKKTLLKYHFPENKISIIPYGFPNIHKKDYRDLNNKKIKILYAGNMSQLKGLSYMFEAVEYFSDKIELHLVGSIAERNCKILMESIQKHIYLGSISHNKLLEEMRNVDLLIFPSLCDGFGMVISEAMSQGTPVIATYNSGGPDIINHGENGWLIPSADANAIKDIISYIIKNPNEIKRVGMNALATASKRPWIKYEEEVTNFISKNLTNSSHD